MNSRSTCAAKKEKISFELQEPGRKSMKNALCLIAAVFLSFFFISPASPAQEQYGNLRGVVVDKDGAPLPGVSLVLESPKYGARTAVTSEAGIFRFINITPTIYPLKCELQGFKEYLPGNLAL